MHDQWVAFVVGKPEARKGIQVKPIPVTSPEQYSSVKSFNNIVLQDHALLVTIS